jgi:hypothetical protein
VTGADLKRLRGEFAAAAQKVYDSWDEGDLDTYAGGGICHLIADACVEVAYAFGFTDATTMQATVGENHTWAVVKADDGVWHVDVPWYAYERGGGYRWSKIPGVVFTGSDVSIYRSSHDPDDFEQYAED